MSSAMETADDPQPANYTASELGQLVEDLKSEEPDQRLASIQELVTIATALGPARARVELLPYISDCVDDEDENIEALCGQLSSFVPLVGGAEHASCLLPVYEAVASGEEVALRKLAIDGITALAGVMPAAHVRTHLFEVVKRLAQGQWYAQRSSVCGLFHIVFPALDAAGQQEVLGFVQGLSGDSAAMVRRSLAEFLKHLIPICSQAQLKAVIHPIFLTLCKDDQDSVRLLAVALCVPLAEAMEAASVAAAVIPVYSAAVADTAWRVRYVAADNVTGFQVAIGPELTKTVLLPAYTALLGDSEAEVRTAACRRLLVFCQTLPVDVRAAAIIEALIAQIQERVVDTNEHVRSALAGVIMGLSAILGKGNTIQYLLPLFLTLLKDENAEVRLNIISNLDEVNKVVGIQQLATALQPAINELAQHDEWRVRQQIIEHTPLVSKQLGVAFFDEHLCDLCLTWLQDKIFTVRGTAVTNIRKIVETFGIEWAVGAGSILPRVLKMANDAPSYSARLVSVFTINSLADICPRDVVANFLIPPLCSLYTDKVANVRFNVAKTLENLLPQVDKTVYQAQIKDVLTTMSRDDDGDVKFFASRALARATELKLA